MTTTSCLQGSERGYSLPLIRVLHQMTAKGISFHPLLGLRVPGVVVNYVLVVLPGDRPSVFNSGPGFVLFFDPMCGSCPHLSPIAANMRADFQEAL